ncbi:DNA primase [Streptomyces phage Zuko]|uniref:DNA primase n=1 Tax=Streptomyces phage Zuko TaxID=2601695 RepID=A0A5J6D7U2_9CAUD|nr:DNA primase [Streptomyces phage Zuko]QEQ93646.1 DNA primase [Streptomyces phage Zuko]
MDQNARAEELTGFLRNLYGDRKVSLARATITDRGKSTQTFHEGLGRLKPWSMSIDGLARSMVKKSDDGTEIFYAPTPMKGEKGRKKEQALPNVVVFGDADEGLTADAKAKLVELGACLVRSGGIHPTNGPKYHVYLLLTTPVSPEELETLNRGLKVFIRGDKFDSTTLLRLPGTRNHKYQGSPLVKVERLADARHTPENLLKFLGVAEMGASPAATPSSALVMPTMPKDFNPRAPKYARMRKVVREWNGRFQSGSCRRYMATIAIVKDAIKYGFDLDEAYAFALTCEPLQDKQEEENGYSIQKDVARTWRRESGVDAAEAKREAERRENAMAPSGTLTADDIVSTPQAPEAKQKTRTTPPAQTSATLATFSNGLELSEDFGFIVPDLDELLAGEYTPLEPTLVPCGTFALLYPGKSHSLVADRGIGKTHIAIAMVHAILKAGGKVAYFDFEDSPDTFIRDRMMNQHGIPAHMIKTQFLYIGGTSAEIGGMEPDQAIEYLAGKLGDAQWDLVVIDGVSASMGDLDGEWDDNKAVDYKKWHALMVQPFLDRNLATLQLDHSTKSGPRAGGTMQKGAKLTGVEYQVRVHGPNSFTIGRTGQVIIEAVKDRVGRISKHRRTNPPIDHKGDEWPWNDVATFTLASDDNGHITKAVFEPINYQDGESQTAPSPVEEGYEPTEAEQKVIDTLESYGKEISKSALRKMVGGNTTATGNLIDSMVKRGLLNGYMDGKIMKIAPALSAPSSPREGAKELDFSRADRVPRGAKVQRECRKCGEHHTYPDEFAQPDDIGYRPDRPMCKPCASENIESESYMPRDGAEWARRIRERKERDND